MKCWAFLKSDYRIKQFVMNLKVFSKNREWISYNNVLVDTGYDGDILIPEKDFKENGFEQALIIETGKYLAETVSGEELILSSAISEIEINENKLPIIIETFSGNNSFIIGRGILIKLKTALDGFEEKLCLIEKYS